MRRRSPLLFLLFFALCVTPLACQKQTGETESRKIRVVATLFPVYDFARNVGGEKAEVSLLLPPGVEAHSFEPKPADVVRLHKADLFVYTGQYMEPWAEDLLKGVDRGKLTVVDASKGIPLVEAEGDEVEEAHGQAGVDHPGHGKVDPHIWLDLSYAQKMVDNIVDGFVAVNPANKDFYVKNGEAYKAKLNQMDETFRQSLSRCKQHMVVHGGHFAFGYLARRYHLNYVSAYKGSPDAEPSARKLIKLEQTMKKYGITYVFFEELIRPRVAEVLARETGAKLLKLNGAHNVTKDEMDHGITFLAIMEQNLQNLKVGLECE